MAEDTIGSWTQNVLVKFIRDLFQNQPPDFLPNLTAENVNVANTLTLKDKLVVPSSSYRTVGATGQPAFGTNWSNFGTGHEVAQFWKDPLGFVHCRGLVKNTTNASTQGTIFTLPPGYRPHDSVKVIFTGLGAGGVERLDVLATGEVTYLGAQANLAWFSLAHIHFRTS